MDAPPEGDSRPVSRYKTLPPISPHIYKERANFGLRTNQRRLRKEAIWYKPLPPKPDQLPLTISARTLSRSGFLEKYPEEIEKQFISVKRGGLQAQTEPDQSEEAIYASPDEAQMLRVIGGNIIRTLLEDANMQKSLFEQSKEEPFYFAQLENANWPPKNSNKWANWP